MEYKWNSPREWLLDNIDNWDKSELLKAIEVLSDCVNEEDIQEFYQYDMENDGYFEEIQ